jgi:2-polyprenyl-6-methoxyphenol hydroxylase-like FAD-dependent oxidoreductase
MGRLVPGVDGSLNLHHPVACQTLLDAAVEAGATVQRGVRDVSVTPGATPTVTYRVGAQLHTVTASLVVGADGRGSVVRRSAGIPLQQQDASTCIAGLLLDGLTGSTTHDVVMEHDFGTCLLLHQGGGRARAYHVVPLALRHRYTGDAARARFLADATAAGSPIAATLLYARPAGPCAVFPGTDSWTDRPFAEGVVLIGDAAGHNDPGIGCGLSIALRDARAVRDLVLAGARIASDFAPYGVERVERMRRLRLVADLVSAATIEAGDKRPARRWRFAEAMARSDSGIFSLVLGMFAGPETIPAQLVDEAVLDSLCAT